MFIFNYGSTVKRGNSCVLSRPFNRECIMPRLNLPCEKERDRHVTDGQDPLEPGCDPIRPIGWTCRSMHGAVCAAVQRVIKDSKQREDIRHRKRVALCFDAVYGFWGQFSHWQWQQIGAAQQSVLYIPSRILYGRHTLQHSPDRSCMH